MKRLLLLLNLVAIILALAGCADNTRSNVSGVKAKQRQYWDAIHASLVRDKKYPFPVADQPCLIHIPEQYALKMTITVSDGKPYDPFQGNQKPFYFARFTADEWMLISPGPDKVLNITEDMVTKWSKMEDAERLAQIQTLNYDPSNGTISSGDIIRTSTP